jgi:hypothetical protein
VDPATLPALRYDKFRNMGRLGQDFTDQDGNPSPAGAA